MPARRFVVICGGLLVLLLAAAEAARALQAARAFKPPAAAVVDIAMVFELYDKRRDLQDALQSESKALEDKLKQLEQKYKDIVAEIPNLTAGERKNELILQKVKLEMDVKDLKEKELERLRKKHGEYRQEIIHEITAAIETYARAQDLDLVLEKRVTAESDGPIAGFDWPIVHFVKPELEITREIADRLNQRYRR